MKSISQNFQVFVVFLSLQLLLIMSAPFNSPNSTARVPGTPLPRGNVSVQAPNVPILCIGGVVDSEAWVGGSNIAPLTMAIHLVKAIPLITRMPSQFSKLVRQALRKNMVRLLRKMILPSLFGLEN